MQNPLNRIKNSKVQATFEILILISIVFGAGMSEIVRVIFFTGFIFFGAYAIWRLRTDILERNKKESSNV